DVRTGKELEGSGGLANTTNNQMELQAVIEGLRTLREPCKVTLYSDSTYVGQGISSWMAGWKSRGWKRKSGSKLVPVKNVEFWKNLDAELQRHDVTFQHVKGHSGHPENERCDELAVRASQNV
ncbi:MAG: ribonuclease HI, partial [Planctomycetota bacterium]